jgi:serine/threonine-protein kinase RsbW
VANQREFARNITSLEEVFGFLAGFYAGKRLGEEVELTIDLVVEELFTNMVKYNAGGARPIEISIRLENDEITVQLVDTDVDPFDLSSVPEAPVHAPIRDRRPGGLGLHLVRSLVDRFAIDHSNRRMTVTASKKVER